MDFEGFLSSVIRFSNFMTARLVVSGLFFYVLSGFTDIGSSTEGFLPNLDLMNNVVDNYRNIFDILGVSEFALLLIFFLFLTAIHLTYLAFDRIGDYIPPAIIPLPGAEAIKDLTGATFPILRDARGEEHSDAENQRLYEFSRKLERIDEENEAKYREELKAVYDAFSISKTFIIFSALAWLYAVTTGRYSGDPIFLVIILLLAVGTALYTTLAIYRAHHERITALRQIVTHQLLEFSAIWLPEDHQREMARKACVASHELRPATFEVLMPVYGTLDDFIKEFTVWRQKRRNKRQASATNLTERS